MSDMMTGQPEDQMVMDPPGLEFLKALKELLEMGKTAIENPQILSYIKSTYKTARDVCQAAYSDSNLNWDDQLSSEDPEEEEEMDSELEEEEEDEPKDDDGAKKETGKESHEEGEQPKEEKEKDSAAPEKPEDDEEDKLKKKSLEPSLSPEESAKLSEVLKQVQDLSSEFSKINETLKMAKNRNGS